MAFPVPVQERDY